MFVYFFIERALILPLTDSDQEHHKGELCHGLQWSTNEVAADHFCCPRKITWDIYPVSTALASKKPCNGHQGCSLWMTGRCVFWNYGRTTSCPCLPSTRNGYKNRRLVNTCQIVTALTTAEFLASRSTSEA